MKGTDKREIEEAEKKVSNVQSGVIKGKRNR